MRYLEMLKDKKFLRAYKENLLWGAFFVLTSYYLVMVIYDFINYIVPLLQSSSRSEADNIGLLLSIPVRGLYTLYNVFIKYQAEYAILIYSLVTLTAILSFVFTITEQKINRFKQFCIFFASTYFVKTLGYFILQHVHSSTGGFYNAISWLLKKI